MITPSVSLGVVAASKPKIVVAGGSPVTPSPALNWTSTVYCDEGSSCQDYTEERIQGISQTITLSFSLSSSTGIPPSIYYRLNSTPATSGAGYCDSSLNFTGSYSAPIPEGRYQGLPNTLYDGDSMQISTLNVSPNDYLSFEAYGNSPFNPNANSATIQIRNSSDGNVLLDTIVFQQA